MTEVLEDRFSPLPRFYGYKDVLALCYGDDTDQFLDAFCDGSMPLAIRHVVEDTMDPNRLVAWLLRRMIRQLNELLVEARKPVEFPVLR
jgi:hypothetical protein